MRRFEFWLDKWARLVVEREKKLKRGLKVLRTESGLGASGIPHIGSFGDVLRQWGVTLALRDMGFKSELICFSDDRDGLRKVPLGLPNWLEDYIGVPVTDIPDPFKCCASFGEHMSSLLMDAVERAGIEFKFLSGTEVYRKGVLNEQIERILLNAKLVGEIIRKVLGQEKFVEILPYFPVCERCGRIYTTRSYELLPKEHKLLYRCDLEFVGKNKNTGKEVIVRGCGHEGEAPYWNGSGKLSWKVEFAARWTALRIAFEACGKDIRDSVRVNDEICRGVLGWEPPLHFIYEMFLDKGGRKISKSIGNVLSPQVWFRYASVQTLNLLMFKRAEGAREIGVVDVPSYSDELDRLERIYFGLERVRSQRELFNARRLFEYVHFLKPPKAPGIHIPYAKMVEIARILPPKAKLGFAIQKLREWKYVDKLTPSLRREIRKRLGFARSWVEDFERPEVKEVRITEAEKVVLREFIKALRAAKTGDEVQTAVFEVARANNLSPSRLFKILYQLILGRSYGPRLGPYVMQVGKEEVIRKIEKAI
jgi:lysyl-tRNA synthetase class 1